MPAVDRVEAARAPPCAAPNASAVGAPTMMPAMAAAKQQAVAACPVPARAGDWRVVKAAADCLAGCFVVSLQDLVQWQIQQHS